MGALSIQEIMLIWEAGSRQHPIDRALTILAVAFPDISRDVWAKNSLGQRDSALIRVWEQTFGQYLEGYSECPQCGDRLEFQLDPGRLNGAARTGTSLSYSVSISEFDLRFRLPDSRDIQAATECPDIASARSALLERCLLEANCRGAAVQKSNLPNEIVTELGSRMLECEPQTEVLIDLNCPTCDHGWQEIVEIATFLWAEIVNRAKRLMREVHILARAYSWCESEILSLSPWRREYYVQLIGA